MEEDKDQINDTLNPKKGGRGTILDGYGTCFLCPSNFSLIKDIEAEIASQIATTISEHPEISIKQVYKDIREILERTPLSIGEPITLKYSLECGEVTITIQLSQDTINRIKKHIEGVSLYNDVIKGIKYLRGQGCEFVGVVSNATEAYDAPLRDKDLVPEGTFDNICVSYQTGYRKPEPNMFQYMIEVSGINADKIIVIGDSFDCDIKGAYNAGIKKRVLIVRSTNKEDKENENKIKHLEKDGIPYVQISDLKEKTLEQLLKEMGLKQ